MTAGSIVEFCGTGYDAGLLTASFKPHLMLLDYKLPDINGNEVCKRIRSTEDLSSIKGDLHLGCHRPRRGRLSCITAGADAFLKKAV